jgi:hypothetical protein
MYPSRPLFYKLVLKNAGVMHFLLGGRFEVSRTGLVDFLRLFGGIFSSNKRAPAKRKKRFYTSRLQKNEGIRANFCIKAAKNFELLLKIKIKKCKT